MTKILDITLRRAVILGLLASGACASEGPPVSTERSALSAPGASARAQLAARGTYLAARKPARPSALGPPDWAAALDIPELVTEATLEGAEGAADVLPNLGVIAPLRGGSFVMLSTGLLGVVPEPGTDLFPIGTGGDATTLRVKLHVPPGANRVSLEYNFLSAEYPEFKGSAFNDTFSIRIIEPTRTRDFDIAAINSSHFFSVSASRAKDSGFDLYAIDPTNVDTEFTGINPDAGLTDFAVFSQDVPSDTDIELVFTIQDVGDGILDSAVLIDAIQFSALQMLDANPEFIGPDVKVTDDPEQLGDETRGRPVRAAVADGVTRLVLRVRVPGPGTVVFSLPDADVPSDGGLSLGGEAPRRASVNSRTITTAAGANYGIAVYQVPEDFSRCPDPPDPIPDPPPPCGDDELSERTITIQARYIPPAGDPVDTQADLQIKRPPVVLAHGMWMTPVDWLNTPLNNASNFSFTYTDDGYACDRVLRIVDTGKCPMVETTALTQSRVVCEPSDGNSIANAIQEAVVNTQRLGVAVTQVDVVAHGSAGILARQYIAREGGPDQLAYRNVLNLNEGDVNRLITWDTPHLGSPLATRIVAARDAPAVQQDPEPRCLGAVSSSPPAPIEKHAIDDLLPSRVSLVSTPVPSHALVGAVPSALSPQVVERKIGGRGLLFHSVAAAASAKLFGSGGDLLLGHDLFSTVASQRGGLPDSAVSPFTMGASSSSTPDAQFFSSMKFAPMSRRVIELLNRPVGGRFFDNFASSAGFAGAAPEPGAGAKDGSPRAALAGGIHIVTPVDGATVLSGGTVTVEVAIDGDFVPADVSVTLGDSVLVKREPPFRFTLPVPGASLGPISLYALAFDASESSRLSNIVALDARTIATVDTLRILTQDPVLFSLGSHRQLVVLGDYDDGFTRAIAAATTGTVYASSNPAIVSVSADGLLTAVGRGIATISSQNGHGFDSITVTVQGNRSPIPRAGHSVVLACVAAGQSVSVQLDGSGSFDPEGDPLTFTWLEAGVQLGSGPTPVVTLGPGEHDIELVASDGISEPARAMVHVSIQGDTQPPRLMITGDTSSTLECSADFVDAGATASDACDGDLTAAVTATSGVDSHVVADYEVIYQVHDSAGLITTATRSVRVTDRTPPVVSVSGPDPAPLECGSVFADPGATARDACDGDLTAGVIAASHVQPGVPGRYLIDYAVHDRAGLTATASRAVVVADHTPPVVSVAGPNPAPLECGSVFLDPGATAADACDGDLTAEVTAESHVQPGVPGSYTVDYRVHDRAGLTATASRAVVVADHAPPVVSVLGPNPAALECGSAFHDTGAEAADACDGNLTGAVTAVSHVQPGLSGSYTVDYAVRDRAGLTASASRAVLVADHIPPVLSLVGADPRTLECGTPFLDTGATASDACDGNLTPAIVVSSQVQPGTTGSYAVNYQVQDKAGLVAAATRSVVVVDRTRPAITVLGPSPLLTECAAPFHDPGAIAMDLCNGDLTAAIRATSNVNPAAIGTYVVTYRVEDRAHLRAAATRPVQVVDRRPPDVAIAAMRELRALDLAYREFTLSDCATAQDACGGATDINRAGRIVAIHSDEPDSISWFDPDHDIVIVNNSRFRIRNQSNPFGNGRVYEIEFTVRDAQGNQTPARSCFFGVRSLAHRDRAPVDDGRVFTVRP